MTTVTISMPDSLKEFIDHEVDTKGFGNVSEYIRALLREAQTKDSDTRLQALLLEGLTSGEGIPATAEFWRQLKSDAANLLAAHKRPAKTGKKRK